MRKTGTVTRAEQCILWVREIFNDTSVSPQVTREQLELIQEEIESRLDALPESDGDE